MTINWVIGVKLDNEINGNKNCKLCNGAGSYYALNVDEYEEYMVKVKCHCSNSNIDSNWFKLVNK